jgi:hypothetical protein
MKFKDFDIKTWLRDKWLDEYYNTNSGEVVGKHPIEVKNGSWFKLYPLTKDQYQEWLKSFELEIKKLRKKYYINDFTKGLIFLDVAPFTQTE